MVMKYKEIQMEKCMVMKMNKKGFIEKLSKTTNYDISTCERINSILEDNGFIGKNNKAKLVKDLTEKLNFTEEEAENIYEKCMSIIQTAIKEKLRHPFRTQN